MANKIRKGDEVVVTAGNYKGKRGRVMAIELNDSKPVKVKVEGVNMKGVLTKPTRDNPKKERIQREEWLDISNVSLFGEDGRPTRVSFSVGEDGKKQRIAKRSGQVIPTPSYA